MTAASDPTPEAVRLESLWAGSFGDDYIERNAGAYEARGAFWNPLCDRLELGSALEVGCNIGGNLQWLAPRLPVGRTIGVDISPKAIEVLHQRVPGAGGLWSPGRELPFRDRHFELVFTMGVLIHQPESTLPLVMAEMARCSSRYVLMGEYYAAQTEEVSYRGNEGALFRRDYGGIFHELFPEHRLAEQGHLDVDEGFDDVTWWLFERP